MRLIHLDIESYGVFRNQEFDFGSGRFQLVCGPNEAGKSTLLQAIRETLFGFPHQTQYQLFDDEMAAIAKLVLSDGRELRFRRRKGRKEPVAGELSDGSLIDEPGLEQLLGANLSLFQSVFAFSLDELSAGQKGLEQAQLTEALFGGAIGGLANFQRLQKRLKEEAERLFTPRALKRPINSKILRIDQLQQELNAAAAEPAEYQREKTEHKQLQQQIERADRLISQLQDAHQEAKRMCAAWEPFQQLTKLRHQQTGDGRLTLSAEQWEAAKKLSMQREQLQSAVAKQSDVVKQRQAEHSGLASDEHDKILAQQANVQALQQETSRMREFADQLPRMEQQLREVQDELHERLRSMAVAWGEERLEQVPADRQLQKRLTDAARDVHEKRRQLNDVNKLERELRRDLERVRGQLPNVGPAIPNDDPWGDEWEDDWEGILKAPVRPEKPSAQPSEDTSARSSHDVTEADDSDVEPSAFSVLDSLSIGDPLPTLAEEESSQAGSTWESFDDELDLGEEAANTTGAGGSAPASPYLNDEQRQSLERLLAEEATYVKQCSERDSLRRRVNEDQRRAIVLESKMRAMGEAWDWAAAPDAPDELLQLSQRWRDAQPEVRAAQAALGDIVALGKELAAEADATAAHAPPDDETLRQMRMRRDEAWTIIRRHYVDQTSQEKVAFERFQCTLSELADRYIQLVSAADEAADVRQDQASVVAAMKSRQQAIQQNTQRLHAAERRLSAAQQEAAAVTAAWEASWPRGPAVGDARVADWFAARTERDNLAESLTQTQRDWRQFAEQTESYEARLRAASWGEDVDAEVADADTLRAEVRERLRLHQRWLDQSEQLRLDHEKLTAQHDEAKRDQQRIQASVKQAERTWLDLKQQMRLPDTWDAESVSVHLAELNAAKSKLSRKRELEKGIGEMRREVDGFRQRVQRLTGEQDGEPLVGPAIDQLNLLSQQLAQAQENKQQLTARQQEDQRQQRELVRLLEESKHCQNAWDQLIAASGAPSEDAFTAALEGASIHQQLRAAEAQVHAALACDPNRLRVLMSELEQSNAVLLKNKLEKAEENLKKAEQSRNQLHGLEGAARDRLKRLDGSDQAAVVEMERQSQLAEFSELVDQWAPMVLASRLMDDALDRFERKHQPALLSDVAQYLRRMTGGAYLEVKRQLGKSRSLVVVDANGKEKTPNQLSKGAREQLYLAIRIAYVRQYCQSSEPLPLVMDDVLVNFDEERAKRTIEVLLELSDDVQVLMMTCHRRTAKLVYEGFPGMQPILLSHDPSETLDTWIDDESAAPKPRRKRARRKTSASPKGPTQGQLFQ